LPSLQERAGGRQEEGVVTVGELREKLAEVPDDWIIGIALRKELVFERIESVQIDPFPDTPTVILWPGGPPGADAPAR
jgi:hypothetical protein